MSALSKPIARNDTQPPSKSETSEADQHLDRESEDLNPLSYDRLPTEVWERIIKFSGKTTNYGKIDKRTLRAASLVCRGWTKTAQKELGLWLCFFPGGSDLARWMKLPHNQIVQPFYIALLGIHPTIAIRILHHCTRVSELYLSYSGHFDANEEPVDWSLLRSPALSNLRSLQIGLDRGAEFAEGVSSPLDLQLESLRVSTSLHLQGPQLLSSSPNFCRALLTGASQSLRHLHVEWGECQPGSEVMGDLWSQLHLLSNCLEKLTVWFTKGGLSREILKALPSLLKLSSIELRCNVGSVEIQEVLKVIPAGQLKHLCTIHHKDLANLIQDTPSLSTLSQLRVALHASSVDPQDMIESLEELKQVSGSRGIDVFYGTRGQDDNWTYVNEMSLPSMGELVEQILESS
ncbi:hypothetical protein T439DRAFT_329466 [Meredithblackwellia eburnea MCA 4105]